jgi:YebC/PmpR family DNA-binding regulatory protein
MSGHSKWANIKIRKGAQDAKRGKVFTKLTKEITVAARAGGGNLDFNPRLRLAAQKAREANMPRDTIERAIKKGTGELEGESLEELVYEGYGPSGVAVMLELLTDNRNRTAGEVRAIFSKRGGNLGEAGCVGWMFEAKGLIVVSKEGADEDAVTLAAIDAGADDITDSGDSLEITAPPEALMEVRQTMESAGLTIVSAELTRVPTSTVALDGKSAPAVLRLIDELEDHDDVAKVHANFDIPDDILEQLAAQA